VSEIKSWAKGFQQQQEVLILKSNYPQPDELTRSENAELCEVSSCSIQSPREEAMSTRFQRRSLRAKLYSPMQTQHHHNPGTHCTLYTELSNTLEKE
jgi:hypothetical protein